MAALILACADAEEPATGHYLEAWQPTSGRQRADLDELVVRLDRMRGLGDAVRRP